MKKGLYIVIIILLLLVFGVSAFMVGSYMLESKSQADTYDALAEMKDSIKATQPSVGQQSPDATEPDETLPTPVIRDENGMLLEYAAVYEEYPDLVGWIKIEGTVIDYPVMQTPDRTDYYLKRDINGEYSDWGCIYIREQCDMLEPSDNITIYGHNMNDGSMFADLSDYTSKAKWEENPLIFFDSLYDYHVYKIFAVFPTTASVGEGFSYHQMVDAENEEDFNDFIATIKSLDLYDTGITPVYGDKIICLSTCEYSYYPENGRLVVAAYRIA